MVGQRSILVILQFHGNAYEQFRGELVLELWCSFSTAATPSPRCTRHFLHFEYVNFPSTKMIREKTFFVRTFLQLDCKTFGSYLIHFSFSDLEPRTSNNFPKEYMEKVKNVHSTGGYGSQGYRYDWKIDEAQKNLLRTHTTAVSARMLYKLMQEVSFSVFISRKFQTFHFISIGHFFLKRFIVLQYQAELWRYFITNLKN